MKSKKQNRLKSKGKLISFYSGKKITKPPLNQFAEASWHFAHAVLWENQNFKWHEEKLCLDSIKIYFIQNQENVLEAFTEFCERIVLASLINKTNSNSELPNPTTWYSSKCKNGFRFTQLIYQRVESKRLILPLHLIGVKLLAMCYVEYVINPTRTSYNESKELLSRLQEFIFLQHFNNTILKLKYAA